MFFTKYPHPANFTFAADCGNERLRLGDHEFQFTFSAFEGDIWHLRIEDDTLWGPNRCLVQLTPPSKASDSSLAAIDSNFAFSMVGRGGSLLLETPESGFFGVCGASSMFRLSIPGAAQFFGLGEKTFGRQEVSGIRTCFWNTDVWSDFPSAQWFSHPTDPPYFSTPYVIVRRGNEYVGLLQHNPYPSYIETPGNESTRVFVQWQQTSKDLLLSSLGGQPNLWIILGPSLLELTRKLQMLVGTTPLPPLWSLGYHQSRWGYGGHDDLMKLDAEFDRHGIPCSGLWLDLDYMDGFRVFHTNPEMFPAGVNTTADALAKRGRRIVPILDPGVKREVGNAEFDEGCEKRFFCLNPQGREFVGMVWPGETVFPDFTLSEVRNWWSEKVKGFAEEGFAAAWLDMNDPSTGPVDPDGMLFQRGADPHAAHRNQYGQAMQMASRDGLLKARPNERPFLLSRSGFIGTSRFSAIWTGDNLSNYFYLKTSIPTAIGMSLSGLPFAGPDVGGFGGSLSDELALDWFKCAFLFPFFRNHSVKDSRPQEPFSFPKNVARVLRRYIRLRYKFLPHLYNLFAAQETLGEPLLRPLLMHFDDECLEDCDDEFMIGPSILQAPFVNEEEKSRRVILPGGDPWYDASTGKWTSPGIVRVKKKWGATPLYIRCGAMIPLQPKTPIRPELDLSDVRFHLFAPDDWSGECTSTYTADDGTSFDYRNGKKSVMRLRVVGAEGNLAIQTDVEQAGFKSISYGIVIHGSPRSVRVNGSAPRFESTSATLTGDPLHVTAIEPSAIARFGGGHRA